MSSFYPKSVRISLSNNLEQNEKTIHYWLILCFQADIEHPEVSYHRPQQEQRGYGRAYNFQSRPAEEYVELQQKRESDI